MFGTNALAASEGYTEDAWSEEDTDWYPYPSKLLFLLDVADNLGRLRISESLMKLFLIGAIRTPDHIRIYPEVPESGIISEVWHAEKWTKSLDTRLLSPMYAAPNHRHYYVNELAQLQSGRFVIPLRWITRHRKICADAYEVLVDDDGIATVVDSSVVEISASDLVQNFHDLEHGGKLPVWSSMC
ncbi:hypothetical protein MSAN_02278300 [Mycena sanguinolenta]|uniref:Uncharacterized protein n=1 Tax=Mycena sanguinolenta TaxID=230812 RepID=A0A8H7CJ32_9AGAR|nr:hypothetical protein MSAN_02278300 [Mycena sanguinolenta]